MPAPSRSTATRRSAKAADLARIGRCAWHLYSAGHKAQLVIDCDRADLHAEDAVADARWAATGRGGRAAYARPHPPGTAVGEPWRDEPRAGDPDAGRANFRAVVTTVGRLDCLYLHHAGHRRAAFDRGNGWRGGVADALTFSRAGIRTWVPTGSFAGSRPGLIEAISGHRFPLPRYRSASA